MVTSYLFKLARLIIIYTYITTCFANITIYSVNLKQLNFYKYSAILPIVTDYNSNKWVYFTLDIHNKKTVIDIFGGIIENKDKSVFSAGIRELNEESLDIFKNNISDKNSFKKLASIDYKAFRTKLFIVSIKDIKNNIRNNCDFFSKQYYIRRYKKPDHYKRLSLAQTETIGIRKVKLNDLINYSENPNKFPNGITTYYSNLTSCNLKSKENFRFEAGILLSFASLRDALLDYENSGIKNTNKLK